MREARGAILGVADGARFKLFRHIGILHDSGRFQEFLASFSGHMLAGLHEDGT